MRLQLVYLLVVGCSLLAGLAAARTGPGTGSQATAQAKQTSRDPYVDTPGYQTFPWSFKGEHAFIFIVNPISSTPTPDAAYAGYTEKLSMLPGPQNGMIVAFKYADSAIGPYSEILYSPGLHPTGCGTENMQNVARIWVDSAISQRAGRNIWGMPKELATFDWSTGPGWVKVSVKDNNSGKVIFEAKMADVPIPQFLTSKAMQMASAFMPGCVPTVQLPIDENTGKTEYADVPAYGIAQKAFKSKPMGRVTSSVCFDITIATPSKIMYSFVDPEAWTGRSQESISLLPLSLKFPAGATATLTAPVLCQPAAAAAAAAAGGETQKQQRTGVMAGVSSIRFPFFG